MKLFLKAFLVMLISFKIMAQEPVLILQSKVLEKVHLSNNTLKINAQEVLMAKGDYNQTNAVLLPNIKVSYSGIETTSPLMAFGSKLNQGILVASDFNPIVLNDPEKVRDFITKIEVQQPILNFDGMHQRKAAKAKLQATTLQSQRTKEYLDLEVVKAYMQLQLAYKTVDVLEKAAKAALENKRLATNALKQGYLQKADVLAVDVRVLDVQNKLQNARSEIGNASNELSLLMNDTSGVIYKPADSLVVAASKEMPLKLSGERADFKALTYATKARKEQLKAANMAFLPRLNAFWTFELHDPKIFKGRSNGYLIGAQISWDILQGSKRFGERTKSKAAFEKATLEKQAYLAKSQIALNKANRMLTNAKNSLRLSALALEQSKESLRIRTNRFKQGLEKTTDLLASETQYSQKQLAYYATVFKHNYALAYVAFLTK